MFIWINVSHEVKKSTCFWSCKSNNHPYPKLSYRNTCLISDETLFSPHDIKRNCLIRITYMALSHRIQSMQLTFCTPLPQILAGIGKHSMTDTKQGLAPCSPCPVPVRRVSCRGVGVLVVCLLCQRREGKVVLSGRSHGPARVCVF